MKTRGKEGKKRITVAQGGKISNGEGGEITVAQGGKISNSEGGEITIAQRQEGVAVEDPNEIWCPDGEKNAGSQGKSARSQGDGAGSQGDTPRQIEPAEEEGGQAEWLRGIGTLEAVAGSPA
ncbi:MAG: hypothetical protein HQ581_25105 [Planctomycetes bacterium]|nr:hypothetical protein [Planctomycetota bacterium]